MALSTTARTAINRLLEVANLRLETLTKARAEEHCVAQLRAGGHFERAIFPVPHCIKMACVPSILEALPQFQARFNTFRDAAANDVGFTFANDYFRSPDVEVFYALLRTLQPARVLEIGSGNSTRIARQAIRDGKLGTILLSIDPQPRSEIDALADEWMRQPVELTETKLFDRLQAGDFLFIDSSHEVRLGNDGAFLYAQVLPRLAPGVVIHIHDIFLPYDYPPDLLALGARNWNEQYLVQAMLATGNFEVLWPGHYFQKTRPDFAALFPHNTGHPAQSLWLRKTATAC